MITFLIKLTYAKPKNAFNQVILTTIQTIYLLLINLIIQRYQKLTQLLLIILIQVNVDPNPNKIHASTLNVQIAITT